VISVIVPAHNAAETIGGCLEALLHQTVPRETYEVIVVDDGSTDGTAAIARRYEDAGVQVVSQTHQGLAAARNHGARLARGELLLFTDADCQPFPDWIEHLTAPFADPEIVGAKGVYRTRQRGLVPRFVQVEYEDRYDRMRRVRYIDFIDTYSAAYRREVFWENQGFGPTFPTDALEEQGLSFRLAQKGYRMVFVPEARVYHIHDRTVAEYARRKASIGYWKALLTRWYPERILRDSHTPFSVRLQIILIALAGLLLPVALVWPAALWGALLCLAGFGLSTVPFVVKAARRDRGVAVVAPALLAVRALALGSGFAVGWVRFTVRRDTRRKPVISGWQRAVKRLVDIVGALVGLVVCAPLMAVIAVAIKLDSPGPVFFVQERVGENGRPFRMVKFRSMVVGAEEMLEQLIDLERLESPAFKIKNDPRVTRVGRILRRTSLDELPQLINVLKGEMSLVGPRPEETRVVALYNDWHRLRLAVKPGMTGPMQVNGRGDLPLDERVRLELDYIEHYSLRKDLEILLRTIPAVISGKGSY